MVIGTDFDNTLAAYDDLLHTLACANDWIPQATPQNKKAVRDALRRQPNGEDKWQQLQAQAYGTEMKRAGLFEGVAGFVARCRAHVAPLYIVSHKTRHAAWNGADLHKAAWAWMEQHRFFDEDGLALPRDHVFFEPTRADKLARIARLGCTHFIDDLDETFNEAAFPGTVERILFDPWNAGSTNPDVRPLPNWQCIGDCLFGETA